MCDSRAEGVAVEDSCADSMDDADSCASTASSLTDHCKLIVIRRYCIIYQEHVPDEYFLGGLLSQACKDLQEQVVQLTKKYTDLGYSFVEHEYAKGMEPNVQEDQQEMWYNIPDLALDELLCSLRDKVEDIFEEYGFEMDC